MKRLSRPTVLLAALVVVAELGPTGCGRISIRGLTSPFRKKDDFQGYYLTVFIDGRETAQAEKRGDEQLWTVGECSGNPTIRFHMDTGHLGDRKTVGLVINPMKGTAPDHGVLFQNDSIKGLKPGKDLTLDGFDRIGDGKLVKLKGLPPGKYWFSFMVNGHKTWDRQRILVEVK